MYTIKYENCKWHLFLSGKAELVRETQKELIDFVLKYFSPGTPVLVYDEKGAYQETITDIGAYIPEGK